MNELALFSGSGGGLLASHLIGLHPVCAVEINRFCRRSLLRRQADGFLPWFPIWDDVRTFKGRPWRGAIDIITGGFPCQDISVAGKGAGLAGSRSGLWFEYLRIVDEVRPYLVWAENSPNLRTHGLGTVIKGLASLGYDARWGVLGAWHVGAPHKRDRIWILAHDHRSRLQGRSEAAANRHDASNVETWRRSGNCLACGVPEFNWNHEPVLGRGANGVANRVDRIKAIGNGQVPAVAATAFRILSRGLI